MRSRREPRGRLRYVCRKRSVREREAELRLFYSDNIKTLFIFLFHSGVRKRGDETPPGQVKPESRVQVDENHSLLKKIVN